MSDSTHTILYIMRHIDIGGHVEIPYKKIGITGKGNADLSSRLRQLSNTKSPIQTQCVKAWEFPDAARVEDALHKVLANDRIEGEWFYDRDDDLVMRLSALVELLNGKPVPIGGDEDLFTASVIQKEEQQNKVFVANVLTEIADKLEQKLRCSLRTAGPTLFSDRKDLTYYVNVRKSGYHNLDFGRSKGRIEELQSFLVDSNFTPELHERGYVMLRGLSSEMIAQVINLVEGTFGP